MTAMNKWVSTLLMVLVNLVVAAAIGVSGGIAATSGEEYVLPGLDEVKIMRAGVRTPPGRITLVRKGSEFCAVRFGEARKGKDTTFDSSYESYYQGDGTGILLKENVVFKKEKLAMRRLVGIHPFQFRPGWENLEVKCGPIKLYWFGMNTLHFWSFDQKEEVDHGIELAPTPWTTIEEVDVFDQRIIWYRYDAKRKDTIIPVDKLFEGGNGGVR